MTRMRYVTYSADRPPTGGRPTAPPCSASVTAHLGPPGEDFLYSFKAAPSGRRSPDHSSHCRARRACGLAPGPAARQRRRRAATTPEGAVNDECSSPIRKP